MRLFATHAKKPTSTQRVRESQPVCRPLDVPVGFSLPVPPDSLQCGGLTGVVGSHVREEAGALVPACRQKPRSTIRAREDDVLTSSIQRGPFPQLCTGAGSGDAYSRRAEAPKRPEFSSSSFG